MNIGILIPGFGSNEDDWALPVYQNFVRELAKTDSVRVIALRYPHTRQPYTYHSAQIYPLGWGAWTRGVSRLRLWWDTWQTIKQLHAEKPFDILHGIWADETGALSGWAGKRLGIPSVVSIAGGELVGFPDIGYGLQISRYGRWIVRQAIESNTVVVSPYEHLLKQHLRDTGYRPSQTEYIQLGIDPEMFHAGGDKQPNHLVHVGSLIPIKNQRLLLDTMAQLDDSVTLDIIGEGVLEVELKQYAQELGIGHRVNFLGSVPHTHLHEYYSRAQLHVMTSHHEAFGMSILEAATCGTPTVGTFVGIISNEVELTVTGNDAEKIAGIIESYFDTPQDLKHWQYQSTQLVKNQYTIQHTTKQYIELYQDLIS